MSESLLLERADGVLRVTLNRPEKRNALSELCARIADAVESSWDDRSVRVVLISAESRRAEFAAARSPRRRSNVAAPHRRAGKDMERRAAAHGDRSR